MEYEISERQLRDWRRRGLLPQLSSRGRGRASGQESYWEDPGIVDRAITVHELLSKREQFPGAHHLELWFAGYEQNIETIRHLWLRSLDHTKRTWIKNSSSQEECETILGTLSTRLAKGLTVHMGEEDLNLSWPQLEPLVSELLNASLAPHPDFAIDKDIADTVWAIMYQKGRHLEKMERPNESDIETVLRLIHEHVSIYSMLNLISVATVAELNLAHQRWKSVLKTITLVCTKTCTTSIPESTKETVRLLAVLFGSLCLFCLLILERSGMGPKIEAWLKDAEDMIKNKGT